MDDGSEQGDFFSEQIYGEHHRTKEARPRSAVNYDLSLSSSGQFDPLVSSHGDYGSLSSRPGVNIRENRVRRRSPTSGYYGSLRSFPRQVSSSGIASNILSPTPFYSPSISRSSRIDTSHLYNSPPSRHRSPTDRVSKAKSLGANKYYSVDNGLNVEVRRRRRGEDRDQLAAIYFDRPDSALMYEYPIQRPRLRARSTRSHKHRPRHVDSHSQYKTILYLYPGPSDDDRRHYSTIDRRDHGVHSPSDDSERRYVCSECGRLSECGRFSNRSRGYDDFSTPIEPAPQFSAYRNHTPSEDSTVVEEGRDTSKIHGAEGYLRRNGTSVFLRNRTPKPQVNSESLRPFSVSGGEKVVSVNRRQSAISSYEKYFTKTDGNMVVIGIKPKQVSGVDRRHHVNSWIESGTMGDTADSRGPHAPTSPRQSHASDSGARNNYTGIPSKKISSKAYEQQKTPATTIELVKKTSPQNGYAQPKIEKMMNSQTVEAQQYSKTENRPLSGSGLTSSPTRGLGIDTSQHSNQGINIIPGKLHIETSDVKLRPKREGKVITTQSIVIAKSPTEKCEPSKVLQRKVEYENSPTSTEPEYRVRSQTPSDRGSVSSFTDRPHMTTTTSEIRHMNSRISSRIASPKLFHGTFSKSVDIGPAMENSKNDTTLDRQQDTPVPNVRKLAAHFQGLIRQQSLSQRTSSQDLPEGSNHQAATTKAPFLLERETAEERERRLKKVENLRHRSATSHLERSATYAEGTRERIFRFYSEEHQTDESAKPAVSPRRFRHPAKNGVVNANNTQSSEAND